MSSRPALVAGCRLLVSWAANLLWLGRDLETASDHPTTLHTAPRRSKRSRAYGAFLPPAGSRSRAVTTQEVRRPPPAGALPCPCGADRLSAT